MLEIKHNTLKLRNPENLRFEAVPGLVLGVNSQDIIPAIEEVVEPVIQEVAIAAVAENSYVKDSDEIKQLIFEMTHPIGSIIYTSNPANPSTYLGGGTWMQIKDTFLLSAGDTYSAGSAGGEAEHILTINEMPTHKHPTYNGDGWALFELHRDGTVARTQVATSTSSKKYTFAATESSDIQWPYNGTYTAGGGAAHNNMPPYKVVYVWERTA